MSCNLSRNSLTLTINDNAILLGTSKYYLATISRQNSEIAEYFFPFLFWLLSLSLPVMIYPENFEQKIGFSEIIGLINDACISNLGRYFVSKMHFSSKPEVIEKLHRQVSEFRQMLDLGKPFPISGYFDLHEELLLLKTEGSYISKENLFDLKTSLTVIGEILRLFKNTEEGQFAELKVLAARFEFPSDILKEAAKIIDDKGEIKDNASTKLSDIRKQLQNKRLQITGETRKAFHRAKKAGYLSENAEITIRNGRAVIPVKASDKRSVKGFIHDESASGQTIFIEPVVSFEMNNEIIEFENEERREILKILILFSNLLRPYLLELTGAYHFLGLMDFIRAKVLMSKKINAFSPVITRRKELMLHKAVHPLLFLSHRTNGKQVVPLDLNLTIKNRILMISGPNAGGKSVCMKTLGLLQYMFQCGIPISASPDSKIPVFEHLFLDIGDEQSLENDLSTYSSHLLSLKFFLSNANTKSLILIDEFGTGTEPQLGAAIAEATLEQLAQKETFGLITTHYTSLKLAADRIPGLINGAMLFDKEKMQPLYQLQTGKPGSSFALEIARKIGFPQDILNRAKKKIGVKHFRFDTQLQQMEEDKLLIKKKQAEIVVKEQQLALLTEKYTHLQKEIESNKKKIIRDAKVEALEILKQSNREIEKTIREIRETKANKNKTKVIREQLEIKKISLEQQLINETANPYRPKSAKENQEQYKKNHMDSLKVGDFVEIENIDVVGQLLNIEGDDCFVNVNTVRLKIGKEKLKKSDKKPKFTKQRNATGIINDLNQKVADFGLSIDLRGKRSEEAKELLTHYIDDAILLGIKEVSILHGKGWGILREIIHEYLQTVNEVQHISNAPVDRGGAGITIVVFK